MPGYIISLVAALLPTFAYSQALDYTVLDRYPHSTSLFTQGLELYQGKLFESSGLYGHSKLVSRPLSAATDYHYGAGNRLIGYDEQAINTDTQLSTAIRTQLSHDIRGNLIAQSGPTTTQRWDYNAQDRPTRYTRNASTVARYHHNALGQRSDKQLNHSHHRYRYNPRGQLIEEQQLDLRATPASDFKRATHQANIKAPSATVHFIWLGDIPVAQITQRTEAGIDKEKTEILYLHSDHLNTPRLATNPKQTVVWQWPSSAFGEGQPHQDPDGDGQLTTLNLRFPGQYYDTESGLHYNYFRSYNPSTGRYTQSDPIGLAGGVNTFAYAGNNPLAMIDLFGLCAEDAQKGNPGARRAAARRAAAARGSSTMPELAEGRYLAVIDSISGELLVDIEMGDLWIIDSANNRHLHFGFVGLGGGVTIGGSVSRQFGALSVSSASNVEGFSFHLEIDGTAGVGGTGSFQLLNESLDPPSAFGGIGVGLETGISGVGSYT